MANLDRRAFMMGTAAGLAVPWMPRASYAATALPVRISIKTFMQNSTMVASLKRGISVMLSRAESNPTSWQYQANMHGYVANEEGKIYPNWASCQHGSWYFLPWHRMYLYWFEQILQQAAGDTTLRLPYWNYGDTTQWTMPSIFISPALSSNPLYVSDRGTSANAGKTVFDAVDVSSSTAFAQSLFDSSSSPYGFGGVPIAATHANNAHGALESSPHDLVHDAIGGWMDDVRTAARDPIFWLHHSNIDRLWNLWLDADPNNPSAPHGYNPTTATWLNQSFTFYNPSGTAVTQTVSSFWSEFGNTYIYDTDPAYATQTAATTTTTTAAKATAAGLTATTTAGTLTAAAIVPAAAATGTTATTTDELTATPAPLTLSPKGTVSPLQTGAVAQPSTPIHGFTNRSAALTSSSLLPGAPSRKIVLQLYGLATDVSANTSYDVYLNAPTDVDPAKAGPLYFVARISFFGRTPHPHNPSMPMPMDAGTIPQAYDITALAQAQASQRVWKSSPTVTIVPSRPANVNPAASPTIERVVITQQIGD